MMAQVLGLNKRMFIPPSHDSGTRDPRTLKMFIKQDSSFIEYVVCGIQKGTAIPSDKIVIVFCHANSVTMQETIPVLDLFARELNCIVVGWEYKGYPKNKDPTAFATEQNTTHDLVMLTRELCSMHRIEKERLILMGRSIGTAIVAEECCTIQPAGIILISPLSSVRKMGLWSYYTPESAVVDKIDSRLPACLDIFRSVWHIPQCTSKFVVVHGRDDMTIPVQSAYDIRKAVEESKGTLFSFRVFDGANHDNLIEMYYNDIMRAFRKLVDNIRDTYKRKKSLRALIKAEHYTGHVPRTRIPTTEHF